VSLPYFSCAIIAPAVYRDSLASGERERARYCRGQVIPAKDRAKFLAITPRGTPERRSQKEEMAQLARKSRGLPRVGGRAEEGHLQSTLVCPGRPLTAAP
jgi:hypothetical protein